MNHLLAFFLFCSVVVHGYANTATFMVTKFVKEIEDTVHEGDPWRIKNLFDYDFKAEACRGEVYNVDEFVELLIWIGKKWKIVASEAKFQDIEDSVIQFIGETPYLKKVAFVMRIFAGEFEMVSARFLDCDF